MGPFNFRVDFKDYLLLSIAARRELDWYRSRPGGREAPTPWAIIPQKKIVRGWLPLTPYTLLSILGSQNASLDDMWEKSCAKSMLQFGSEKKFARYAVCDGESAILLFKRAELTSNRIAGTGED